MTEQAKQVRLTLPDGVSPRFPFQVQDHLRAKVFRREDDTHILLEFDTPQDAADVLSRAPIQFKEHTLSVEALAPTRDATPSRGSVHRLSGVFASALELSPPDQSAPSAGEAEPASSATLAERMRKIGGRAMLGPSTGASIKKSPPPAVPKKPASVKPSPRIPRTTRPPDEGNAPQLPVCEGQGPPATVPRPAPPRSADAGSATRPRDPPSPKSPDVSPGTASASPVGGTVPEDVVTPRQGTEAGAIPKTPGHDVVTTSQDAESPSGESLLWSLVDEEESLLPRQSPTPNEGGEVGILTWKASDFAEADDDQRVLSGDSFEPLTEDSEDNTYLHPVHIGELGVPGNPYLEPTIDSAVSMMSHHTYEEIDELLTGRQEALFSLEDDFSIVEERAPSPSGDSQSNQTHPIQSGDVEANRDSSLPPRASATNQNRMPQLPRGPLPELPIGQYARADGLGSVHLYSTLNPLPSLGASLEVLNYPSLDLSVERPGVTVSEVEVDFPSWTSSRGPTDSVDDRIKSEEDGEEEFLTICSEITKSRLDRSSDLDDITYSLFPEEELEVERPASPDRSPPDETGGQSREHVESPESATPATDEGRTAWTGARAGNETPKSQPSRTSATKNSDNEDDEDKGDEENEDDEDDEDNEDDEDDEDGPMELSAFLQNRAVEDKPSLPVEAGATRNPAGEEKTRKVSRQLDLPQATLKLLAASRRLTNRARVKVVQRNGRVFLEGDEESVLQMAAETTSLADSLQPVSRPLPSDLIAVLNSKRAQAKDALKARNIRGFWVVHDDKVHVIDSSDPDTFFEALRDFCKTSLPQPARQTPDDTPSRRAPAEGVVTQSLKLEELLGAVGSGAMPSKIDDVHRFLQKNKRDLFGNLGIQCDDPNLTLTLDEENGQHLVKVTGLKTAAENVMEIVRIYLADVTQVERVLRDDAVSRVWQSAKGQEVLGAVSARFPNYVVTAEALPAEEATETMIPAAAEEEGSSDSDEESAPALCDEEEIVNSPTSSPSPPSSPVRSQPATAEGSVLHVLPALLVRRGDLLELQVDAIVHGTNDQLTFDTNLGKALLQKVSGSLQQTCTNFVQREGRLPAGTTFCTPAGPGAKFTSVVHASLPTSANGRTDGRLRDTVVAALTSATGSPGHHTVALPALGAKSSGVSTVDAVLSVIQGVAAFSLANPAHGLHRVTLCDVNEDACRIFATVLPELLALNTDVIRASLKLDASLLVVDSKLQRPDDRNPHVQLVLGSIQNQQVAVIVNSTRPDLILTSGSISKSLVTVAGPSLQQEAQSKFPQGIAPGKLCVTSAGRLPCKAVFHVTLPEYKGDNEVKSLEATVTQCLEQGEKGGHTSIAFPALGTGNLRYPRGVVIATILKCVAAFRQRHGTPSLKQVMVVAYPSVAATVATFRQSMTDFIQTGKITASASLAVPTVKVGSVTVEMKVGDVTTERTDAIVNGCQESMNLDLGMISKKILQVAGPGLQKECIKLQAQMAKDKVVVSGSGKLSCKKVIHVVTQPGVDHWRAIWPKVLDTCQSLKLTSLSIPPIGTGGMHVSPRQMGELLCEALKKMTSRGPVHLTTVRVVFLDQVKLNEYADGFLAKHVGGLQGPPVPCMSTEEVRIGTLRVAVALGDITTQTSAAILNFCGADLDLSHGILSSAILKAAGPELQRLCQQKKKEMKKDGVIVTGPGRLQCQRVIHVTRAASTSECAMAVQRAVCKAQADDLSPLSIPAPSICGHWDAVTVSGAMLEGLKAAGTKGGTSIQVRLVLNSPDVVGAFVQRLRGLPASPQVSPTATPRMRTGRVREEARSGVARSTFRRAGRTRADRTANPSLGADVSMTSCVVPVRVTVTGMGAEGLQRPLKEVLEQCKTRVISRRLLFPMSHGTSPRDQYRNLRRLSSASRVKLTVLHDGIEVMGLEDDVTQLEAEMEQLTLE